MNELDIKEIMNEIKHEALIRMPEAEKLPDLLDVYGDTANNDNNKFDKLAYANYLMLLNRFCQVPLDRPIPGVGGIKGKIITVFKKVTRKLIRWYIIPVVDELNDNSSRNVNLHNQTSLFMNEQKIEIERLKSNVAHLQEKIRPESSTSDEDIE